MILTKKIKIKSNKRYEEFGYDITKKTIIVNIEHLAKGSNKIILAKCDYCGKEKHIKYSEYNNNIKDNPKFSCGYICGAKKLKENNLKKYGVESTMMLDDVKNKVKKTNLEKYGCEHNSQNENIKKNKKEKYEKNKKEISEKIKTTWSKKSKDEKKEINKKRENTNIKKYGTNNVSQNKKVKDKKRITFDEKYSGFTFESTVLKEKVDKTNLERYGTTNTTSNPEVKNKMKKTNIKKYGVEFASQNKEIKNKIKTTFKNKYNVDNIVFSEEFRKKNFIIAKDKNYIRYVGGQLSEFKCDCGEDHLFEIDTDNYFKRTERYCKLCTKCYPIGEQASIKEMELFKFIKNNYVGKIIRNYRDGIEIDVFLPEINLGFEFNGLYWHSDAFVENDKHLNKLNYFKNKNIRVIFIWEDDWDLRQEIIKSQIKNVLKISENKIYARKCEIRDNIDIKIIREFLNSNHIQGFVQSTKKIGLFYNNVLVSLMTFDKFEGRNKLKEYEWNLSRFCNILNTNVIGAASKLLKYFIKNNNCKRIISYADKSWSNGNLYYKLGFKLVNESGVNYKYIINNQRTNKQRYKKEKLKNNENKTEKEIMKSFGVNRIYDCGQLKFELKIN